MTQYFALTMLAFLLGASGCTANRGKDVPVASTAAAHGPEPSPVEPDRSVAPAERVPAPQAEKPKAPVKIKTAALRPASRVQRVRAFEDPRHIQAGIAYDDMVRRFGPPSMKVTAGPGRTSISYANPKSRVQVEVENGKVISVETADTGL